MAEEQCPGGWVEFDVDMGLGKGPHWLQLRSKHSWKSAKKQGKPEWRNSMALTIVHFALPRSTSTGCPLRR